MLENLQNEVENMNKKILYLCKQDSKLNQIYKGCQVFYSPFIKKPKLMIIGINPGSGYYKSQGKIVQKFEPIDNYNEGGVLFEELRYMIFKEMNKQDIFLSSFITNAYYFATEKSSDLNNFLKLLPEDLRSELKQKSTQWLKYLISTVSPKIILCTGHQAFDIVKSFYAEDMVISINKGHVLEAKIDSIPVIACKRMFSTIVKKPLLIQKLTEYLNEN